MRARTRSFFLLRARLLLLKIEKLLARFVGLLLQLVLEALGAGLRLLRVDAGAVVDRSEAGKANLKIHRLPLWVQHRDDEVAALLELSDEVGVDFTEGKAFAGRANDVFHARRLGVVDLHLNARLNQGNRRNRDLQELLVSALDDKELRKRLAGRCK